MFYVYIIKSTSINYLYLGCTGNLTKRLEQHNYNKVNSTKDKGPFEIRYYEAFFSKEDAFNREQKLKKNYRGLQELRKRVKNSLS